MLCITHHRARKGSCPRADTISKQTREQKAASRPPLFFSYTYREGDFFYHEITPEYGFLPPHSGMVAPRSKCETEILLSSQEGFVLGTHEEGIKEAYALAGPCAPFHVFVYFNPNSEPSHLHLEGHLELYACIKSLWCPGFSE